MLVGSLCRAPETRLDDDRRLEDVQRAILGAVVDAVTTQGDSGAAVYDTRNRFIGMVFAVSERDGSTWVTAANEIETVIEDAAEIAGFVECDPDRSRIAVP